MEQFLSFNIGQIAQVVTILIFIGMWFQQIKGDIKYQADRLSKIEAQIEEFREFLITSAKFEERLINLSNIVLSQGKRLDRLTDRVHGRQTQESNE